MRAAAVIVALLPLLAACGESAPPAPPESSKAETPVPAAAPPVELPPAPRYVGRWAARASECTTAWWRFWADELRTGQPQARCDILPPDGDMGDERRRAVCVSNGQAVREEWVMTYPADRLMTISRNGAAPVTLGKCT